MKHDISPELTELFKKKASFLGYSVREEAMEHDPQLLLSAFRDQEEICKFEKTGAMRYFKDSPFVAERKELHNLLLDLKERYDLYLNAKPLDCEGVRDFRLISESEIIFLPPSSPRTMKSALSHGSTTTTAPE